MSNSKAHCGLLLLFVLFSANQTFAILFWGAELSYTCINSCTIEATVRLYQPCDAAYPILGIGYNPFSSDSTGCNPPIQISNWQWNSLASLTPLCSILDGQTTCSSFQAPYPGCYSWNFTALFDVRAASPCRFDFEWRGTGRPGNGQTILNPSPQQWIYLGASDLDATMPCNSSPHFTTTSTPPMCCST